jgi:hypothetical protein
VGELLALPVGSSLMTQGENRLPLLEVESVLHRVQQATNVHQLSLTLRIDTPAEMDPFLDQFTSVKLDQGASIPKGFNLLLQIRRNPPPESRSWCAGTVVVTHKYIAFGSD